MKMKSVFLLMIYVFNLSICAKVVSIITDRHSRIYFVFDGEQTASSTVKKICGHSKKPLVPVKKEMVKPHLPWQLAPVLKRYDTQADFAPSFMDMPSLVQNLNREWNQQNYDELPNILIAADLTTCFPEQILSLLKPAYKSSKKANCFNNVLNFHFARDIVFNSEKQMAQELVARFEPISKEQLQFGDVVVLYVNDEPWHAYVWVTEEWAWTKNGKEPTQRHRFQRISSLHSVYEEHEKILYFTKK